MEQLDDSLEVSDMGLSVFTVFACLVVGLFSIFWIFPLIGKAMRFIVDKNTEKNEYRANLMNGFTMIIFLAGLTFLVYCVGIVLGIVLAAL